VAPALERARAGRERRVLHDGPHGREHGLGNRERSRSGSSATARTAARAPRSSRRSRRTPEVTFTDVLGSVFGVTSDYGAILVTSDSLNVKVLSQTSTPPPSQIGTFGQSVPAAGPADLVTLAAPRVLVGLRQDSAFRTNAVIANATGQPAHVDLTLTSAAGATLGSTSADLLPYEMRQIGAVVTALGAPDGTADAALTVATTTPGARIATYAAIIDQVTNDPRTVLP
jgi:hypothetical protein